MTRSHYAGSQQFAAVWTGDNSATWEHFEVSISQCLTGNILGMVFCGADIGGFIGDPSDELLQRWYQVSMKYYFSLIYCLIIYVYSIELSNIYLE